MTDQGRGPWAPGRGKSIEEATKKAWDNAKKGQGAPGFAAERAPAGTYKLEIWIETTNPIRSYIVNILPTGP